MNPSINRVALILASGDDVPLHPPLVGGENNKLVICADGGAALARQWDLVPEVILGDQDSLDPGTKAYWQRKEVPFRKVSPIKDETDMDLAVEYALEQGVHQIVMAGGWGSRIDHSLGNIELLYRLALRGIENSLLTREQRLSAFCGEFRASVNQGSLVSLIPLSPQATGVRSTGLLYPLEDAILHKGSTLTISNVAVATDIMVGVETGVLLVIMEQ